MLYGETREEARSDNKEGNVYNISDLLNLCRVYRGRFRNIILENVYNINSGSGGRWFFFGGGGGGGGAGMNVVVKTKISYILERVF